MDTRFLQSFVTVVECGSLAEAGRRLDLTATAVAARLRALEESLGVVLVQRSGRTVRATEAGLKILEQSRAVLRDIGDLCSLASTTGEVGQLRCGVFISASTTLLPPIMTALYAAHPGLSVAVDAGYSPELCRKVVAHELDVAIVVEHQFAIPKTCEWLPLVSAPLVVVAPASVPAQADPHQLLRTQPYLRYDRRVWGGRLADRYLSECGIRPQVRLEIDGMAAILNMVEAGLGVTLLPDWPLLWRAGSRLRRVPLPGVTPQRRLGILRQVRGPRAAWVDALVHAAQQYCANPPADLHRGLGCRNGRRLTQS